MKDAAPAGDAAHPPGKWLHMVWDVVPVLPQGLVSQILQNRGPMESHGQLTRMKGFLEVIDAQSTKPLQPGFLLVPTALLSHNSAPGSHPRAEAAEVHRGCPGKLKCRK